MDQEAAAGGAARRTTPTACPYRAGGEPEHLEAGFRQLAPHLVLGEVVVERVPQRVAELHGEAAASQPEHGPRDAPRPQLRRERSGRVKNERRIGPPSFTCLRSCLRNPTRFPRPGMCM